MNPYCGVNNNAEMGLETPHGASFAGEEEDRLETGPLVLRAGLSRSLLSLRVKARKKPGLGKLELALHGCAAYAQHLGSLVVGAA
jgi:hypothetical protein